MSGRSKLGIAMSVIVLMSVQETIRAMITIANHGFLKKYYVEKDFDVLIGPKVFELISSVEQSLEVAYKYFPPYISCIINL
jgi:hypothetical protein